MAFNLTRAVATITGPSLAKATTADTGTTNTHWNALAAGPVDRPRPHISRHILSRAGPSDSAHRWIEAWGGSEGPGQLGGQLGAKSGPAPGGKPIRARLNPKRA